MTTLTSEANSLVALGDDDGTVRLLDSAAAKREDFHLHWIKFKAHKNAIIDMSFSPDDLRLATAAGDQSSTVIDMTTQQTLYTMSEHLGSVKRTRFQPGSSNILASSGRDGSVLLWDLRCKGSGAPFRDETFVKEANSQAVISRATSHHYQRSVNAIFDAHTNLRYRSWFANQDESRSQQAAQTHKDQAAALDAGIGDVSVTSVAFLSANRPDLLLTCSEANASVRLWDLRRTQLCRGNRAAVPISTTKAPMTYGKQRSFGVTSLSVNESGSRVYAVCRDNTVYAYSAAHLVLGSAPELAPKYDGKFAKTKPTERGGLGPLYGLRHPRLRMSSFYICSDIRHARGDRSELLVVGSSENCAVVIPTDEKYLDSGRVKATRDEKLPVCRSDLSKRDINQAAATQEGEIPMYQIGSALVEGHTQEVGGVTWTYDGDLMTFADDRYVRCWREDADTAREIRANGDFEGRRWHTGWAEVDEDAWDEDEI